MTAVSVPAGEAPLGSLIAPEPDERPDLWPSTARRGDDGSLRIGGRCLTEILAEAPTPVFVLDEACAAAPPPGVPPWPRSSGPTTA